MGNWYYEGEEDGERHSKKVDSQRAEQAIINNRFWLKAGSEATITFLSTVPFYVHEHSFWIQAAKRYKYYTCINEVDNCPLCEANYRENLMRVFTIIDHTKYKSKVTGKTVSNRKKLLVLTKRAWLKLADRKKEQLNGDLTRAVFRVKRHSTDECKTGEDFVLKTSEKLPDGRLPEKLLEKLIPKDIDSKQRDEWLKPYDYVEIFKPKSVEELRQVAGAPPPVGSDDSLNNESSPPPPEDELEKYL